MNFIHGNGTYDVAMNNKVMIEGEDPGSLHLLLGAGLKLTYLRRRTARLPGSG